MANEELVASFQDQCRNTLDMMVDNACKTILLEAGIRQAGQRIKVLRGTHAGFEGVVETINWTEAEVRCKGNARWFSLWHRRDFFQVLDPIFSGEVPKAGRLATAAVKAADNG